MAAQVQSLTKRREWEDRPPQGCGEPFQRRQTVVFRIIVLEKLNVMTAVGEFVWRSHHFQIGGYDPFLASLGHYLS